MISIFGGGHFFKPFVGGEFVPFELTTGTTGPGYGNWNSIGLMVGESARWMIVNIAKWMYTPSAPATEAFMIQVATSATYPDITDLKYLIPYWKAEAGDDDGLAAWFTSVDQPLPWIYSFPVTVRQTRYLCLRAKNFYGANRRVGGYTGIFA